MLERAVFCAGTVRTNRKHLPQQDVVADEQIKLGDVSCFPAQKLVFEKWKDNKAVHMLSNY